MIHNFILKGGMLVASVVGVDMRATMDIDTTVRALPLNETDAGKIDKDILKVAFRATCEKRETLFDEGEMKNILVEIKDDEIMAQMWEKFQRKNFFVGDLQWETVLSGVSNAIDTYIMS